MAQETVLDGDWSSSFLMARGLMQLQQLFGPIPVIKGKGPAADAVAEGLARMTEAATASLSLPGEVLTCAPTSSNVTSQSLSSSSSDRRSQRLEEYCESALQPMLMRCLTRQWSHSNVPAQCRANSTASGSSLVARSGSPRERFGRGAGTSAVDELILIDREADCITPMCTQLTYEGLLDEVLGIKNGAVTLEPGGEALAPSTHQQSSQDHHC